MISVIIPVHNGGRRLPACLRALQLQTRPPDEIIVVDDGSTDGTAAVAARYGATVLSQPRSGPASARNRGARAARGQLLLFTDADCAPAPDWVERLIAPFADPAVAGVQGEYRTHQQELVARFVQQEYQDRYDRMAGWCRIDSVDTYAAGFRRDLFLRAGGFDPAFPIAACEDREFSFRLTEQGYRLVYVPGAIVYHHHNRTLPEYGRRKYWVGYWMALATRRHPARLARDSHTPQVLKLQLALAGLGTSLLLARAVTGRRGLGLGGGLAWGLLWLSGFSFYKKIGQRDAPVLAVAPILLLVRAWSLGLGFLLGNLRFIWRQPKGKH